MKISKVEAIEILDSRGNPTVEVDLTLEDGSQARAMVPSGASTGEREATELRDGDAKRYGGKGVLKAVANVNEIIASEITDKSFVSQRKLGQKVELVGDDLFCTNKKILQEGIDKNVANSILIKLNQIGTVTETLETMELARNNGYNCFVSHRSGETADSFIADLTVGLNAGHIKTGSGCRGERIEKFNQFMRIEHQLKGNSIFAGKKTFKNALK